MTNPAADAQLRERRARFYAQVAQKQRRLRARLGRRWKASRVRRWLNRVRVVLHRWRTQAPAPTLLFLGWAAITAGVAEIGAARIVWAISAGLFAWGLYGYKILGLTLWLGLELLKRTPRKTGDDR